MGGLQEKGQTGICPQWHKGVHSDCHLFTLHSEEKRSFSTKCVGPLKLTLTTLNTLVSSCSPLAFLLVYKLHKGRNYSILFTSIYALCLVYRRYSIDTYCFSFL